VLITESETGLCLSFTITGTGRRRRFPDDYKALILEETLAPGAVVSEVARRHGLTPRQVFTWRRQARQGPPSDGDMPGLVPAVVESAKSEPAALPAPLPKNPKRKLARKAVGLAAIIEVVIDGVRSTGNSATSC
jgi:transposase